MSVDLSDLTKAFTENWTRVAFSRLRYLSRNASEEELAEFFSDLLVKAAECRHRGDWEEMERFLEGWEDWLVARSAARMEFLEAGETPWTPLSKPISQCRIALVTTGGIYLEDQAPFEAANDISFREIPAETPQERIRVSHPGYDISGPQEDVNCVFPLHRFQELEAEGAIGALSETHYSFMGLIRDPGLLQETPQEVARRMKAEGVDAVFLAST